MDDSFILSPLLTLNLKKGYEWYIHWSVILWSLAACKQNVGTGRKLSEGDLVTIVETKAKKYEMSS